MAIPMGFFLLTLVPGCPGDFSINGRPVSHEEWIASVGPVLAPFGLLVLALTYGFTKRRTWTRHVAVALFVSPAVSIFFPKSRDLWLGGAALLSLVIPLGLAVWYFYAKPNVVEYYRELGTGSQANMPMQRAAGEAGRR